MKKESGEKDLYTEGHGRHGQKGRGEEGWNEGEGKRKRKNREKKGRESEEENEENLGRARMRNENPVWEANGGKTR